MFKSTMKFLLLLPLTLLSAPAHAITWEEFWEPFQNDRVYVYERPTPPPMCKRRVYREEYIPGNYWNPGYVKRYNQIVKVPCW